MSHHHIAPLAQLILEGVAFATVVIGAFYADRCVREGQNREVIQRRSLSARTLGASAQN